MALKAEASLSKEELCREERATTTQLTIVDKVNIERG
jgi:hypothetical protein